MKRLLLLICLMMVLLIPTVALAGYDYYVPVRVYNNSTADFTDLVLLVDINNTQLAVLGFIDADGLDTYVFEDSTPATSMVANDKLGIYIPSLLSYQLRTFNYQLGYDPPRTRFPVIVGVDGNITVADADELELGGNFTVRLRGYIVTDFGYYKNLIFKDDSFCINITADGNITATINPGAVEVSVTASGVYTGLHTINVTTMDGVNLVILIDDVEKDSTAFSGAAVNNTNDWAIAENETILYLDYLKVWVR